MTLPTAYVFLAISIVAEIIATSTLPATEGFTKLKPSLISIIGYIICFYCLGMCLTHIPLGIAYGTSPGARWAPPLQWQSVMCCIVKRPQRLV